MRMRRKLLYKGPSVMATLKRRLFLRMPDKEKDYTNEEENLDIRVDI